MKVKATHRGYNLTVQSNRNSGDWSGMAKGFGGVILQKNFSTHEDAIWDLMKRIDAILDRPRNVAAK